VHTGKLYRFLPEVDMNVVHHMLLYMGKGCYGKLIYAWARTGQTTPIGLDLNSWNPSMDFGYAIGDSLRYVSLQIHYQARAPVMDSSGLRIWYSSTPPKTPLVLNINALMPDIPARSIANNCIACKVVRSGTVYGWRNHAHKLGRDIWSDHFATDGAPKKPIGLISSQQPSSGSSPSRNFCKRARSSSCTVPTTTLGMRSLCTQALMRTARCATRRVAHRRPKKPM